MKLDKKLILGSIIIVFMLFVNINSIYAQNINITDGTQIYDNEGVLISILKSVESTVTYEDSIVFNNEKYRKNKDFVNGKEIISESEKITYLNKETGLADSTITTSTFYSPIENWKDSSKIYGLKEIVVKEVIEKEYPDSTITNILSYYENDNIAIDETIKEYSDLIITDKKEYYPIGDNGHNNNYGNLYKESYYVDYKNPFIGDYGSGKIYNYNGFIIEE